MEYHQKLNIPPLPTPFPDLDALVTEWQDLEEKRRMAGVALQARVMGMEEAQKGDREERARALRQGNPDPGDVKQQKLALEKEEWEGKYATLSEAIDQVQAEIRDLIESSREEWVAQARAAADTAREAYMEDVLRAVASNQALRDAYAMLRWVMFAPGPKVIYKPPSGVTSVRGTSGDPVPVNLMLQALLEESEVVPNYDAMTAGPPAAAPGPRTPEEARDLVEQQRRQRIEMGYEYPDRPPRPVSPTLPPNTVVGGRNITP